MPLSAMYSSVLGTDAGQILTRIAPATVLGNCVAIIFGGLANNIGERKPSLTGNGCLVNDGHEVKKAASDETDLRTLMYGAYHFNGIL